MVEGKNLVCTCNSVKHKLSKVGDNRILEYQNLLRSDKVMKKLSNITRCSAGPKGTNEDRHSNLSV